MILVYLKSWKDVFGLAVDPAAENRTKNPPEKYEDQAVKDAHESGTSVMACSTAKTTFHGILETWIFGILQLILGKHFEMQLFGLVDVLVCESIEEVLKLLLISPEEELVALNMVVIAFQV